MIKSIWNWISYWYLRFILSIGIYMMEPMERWIVNSILVAVFAMSVYTSYVFLPGHFTMLVRFIESFSGSDTPTDINQASTATISS
uniref:Serine palmitoyltransferase small subunit A n=1 Tax=Octopus bimaculoides TaxID=37653 RepID=A0A0L8GYH9_OCTBM